MCSIAFFYNRIQEFHYLKKKRIYLQFNLHCNGTVPRSSYNTFFAEDSDVLESCSPQFSLEIDEKN